MGSRRPFRRLMRTGTLLVPMLAIAVWLIPLAQCSGLFGKGTSSFSPQAKVTKVVTDEAEQNDEKLKEERELEKFDLFFVVTAVRFPVTMLKRDVPELHECCKDLLCHDLLSRGPPLLG